MIAVNVVAMIVDDVVDVIVVLHRAVAAIFAVDVLRIVTFANMGGAGSVHASSYGRR
jgi:hypothetical protein